MTTMLTSASPDDFDLSRHCDDLAEACEQYEDGLKASAAACAKMDTSVRGLSRWFVGYGIVNTLALAIVGLALLSR